MKVLKNSSEIERKGETILLDENVEENESPQKSKNIALGRTYSPVQTEKKNDGGLELSRKRSSNGLTVCSPITHKGLGNAEMNFSVGDISSTDFDLISSNQSSQEMNLQTRDESFNIIKYVSKTQ